MTACAAVSVRAVDLGALTVQPQEVQARLQARQDCLAWYGFGEVPKELAFRPAPEGDELKATDGSFTGQRATRIYHGELRGKVLEVPPTGFTLCCWLKVHGIEAVDRDGYQRTCGGVMASGSGWFSGWRLCATPGSAGLQFTLGGPEGGRTIASSGFLTVGEWHHVAVTWDRKTLVLWLDGVAQTQLAAAMDYHPAKTLPYFRIGECREGTGVLDFEIADLGFFGTALPAAAFEGLGNPDAVAGRALTEFLKNLSPPPGPGPVPNVSEQRYRQQFEPLLALGWDTLPAYRQVRSYVRLLVARSLLRSELADEARAAFRQLAADDTAMLVHRARAMLALGDMERDQRHYAKARREYEAMQEFFVGKHEEFRVEALARLRDIATLQDGEPFRNERQRRIDHVNGATPWFHVSPQGDDGNPGTREVPFRTLERARDALRERRQREPLPAGGVAIVLHGGTYPRLEGSFALTAADSGTTAAPVVYRAATGEEVILQAGRVLDNFVPLVDSVASRRIPEAARSHVLQADLGAGGITDFGKLRPRGRGPGKLAGPDEPAHLELFAEGVAMPLARWPNDTPKMSDRFAHVDLGDQPTVRDTGRTITKDSNTFYYSDSRQDAWAAEPDPWLFGYWQRAYFSSYRKILRLDPAKNEIQVDWNQSPTDKARAEMVKGSGYQGINLLCELDSPGEWYLDRATGILYFWPPSPLSRSRILVSMLETPVLALENASHVVFRGLTIEGGRQHGVVVKDGEQVLLAGCVVRNMGCMGMRIDGGRGHQVIGCDLSHLGDAGIDVAGGDRATLTPSGHVVENCHIHHFAHWDRGAYQPGIRVAGVGVRMSHCLIHDAPHQAFLLGGNDHVTEFCEVHDVVHEAGDAGAWYMYGGGEALAERGNVVRYNYWHDLPYNETFQKYHCVCHMGVYIDNVNGGVTVYGNLFSHFDGSSGAVFFGGSDDIVENNVFHRCRTGVNVEDRSWVYAKTYRSNDAFLAKMKVHEPPWGTRYPRLATIKPHTEDLSLIVRGNVVARNIGLDCDRFIYGRASTMGYARIERNWEEGDPGFRDADGGDFRLEPNSPAIATCLFEPLPLGEMGLYNDEFRASWPVRHPAGNYETLYVDTSKIAKEDRKPVADMRVCQATSRTAAITVDGVLAPSEWGGLDPAAGYVLSRTPADEPSKARPSMMWLRRDAADLYIALRHELEPGQNPVPKAQGEPWWGNADIAEVVFEGQGGDWWPTDKGHGPIFYLVGDCTGAFESYAIAGLPKPRAEGLQGAVQYAAMAGAGVWTAEWRIPLAALGLDPDSTKGCSFNVGVHKPRSPSDKWAVWVGAGGANWQVWNAGWLELGK